jgi:uroporphyrinogen-III decarboxylase
LAAAATLARPLPSLTSSAAGAAPNAELVLRLASDERPDLILMDVELPGMTGYEATRRLKAEFGDRLSFWGAIDTQHVLPNGSIDDVKREVERRIADLAPGGGYIVAPVHNAQADVPPENILTMYRHARQVGRYPLQIAID